MSMARSVCSGMARVDCPSWRSTIGFRWIFMLRWPLKMIETLERSNKVGAVSHLWNAEIVGREVLHFDGVAKLL